MAVLAPAQKEILAGWPREKQDRFHAEWERTRKQRRQIMADVRVVMRSRGRRILDPMLTAHGLPIKPLSAKRQARLALAIQRIQTLAIDPRWDLQSLMKLLEIEPLGISGGVQ